ncbi:MAG: 2'-5' RNA ligase family protein [Anaerolineae bacterium]
MQAVIASPDPDHFERLSAMVNEIGQTFTIRVDLDVYPRLTLAVAERFDQSRIEPALAKIAAAHAPVTLTTSGLGMFTGAEVGLYVAVVKTPVLVAFHRAVYAAVEPLATAMEAAYAPAVWLPHLPLVREDVFKGDIAPIAGYLSRRKFSWQLAIVDLVYSVDTTLTPRRLFNLPLTGGSDGTHRGPAG